MVAAPKFKEYKVSGLHCENCSAEFMTTYRDIFDDQQIQINQDNNHIYIRNDVDWDTLNRIASFEKVMFEPIDQNEHSHDHSHGRDHSHSMGDQSVKKMTFVFFINLFFAIFELVFGTLFNSSAILADAVHDLGDAVSIGLASILQRVSKKEANSNFSFGYERFSLLGGLITGLVLLGGSVFALYHAVPRLFNPEPINQTGVFWVAIVAVIANVISAWLMSGGESTNESMLSLHLLEDILGWLGVLGVSIVLQFTDWYILDPILTIIIAVYIFYHAWPAFKQSIIIFLEGVPTGVDASAIEEGIQNIVGVKDLSHFHLWSIDGQNHALSVTICVNNMTTEEIESLKATIRQDVFSQNITHVTIETIID